MADIASGDLLTEAKRRRAQMLLNQGYQPNQSDFSNVNTSSMPISEDEQRQLDELTRQMNAGSFDEFHPLGIVKRGIEDKQKLRAEGVETDVGTEEGRMAGGFAINEQVAANMLKEKLSDYYGKDIGVRIGPTSGKIEFVDPLTNRWTLMDESNITVSDFTEAVGDLMVFGADTIGSILGAIGGGAVAKHKGILPGEMAGSYVGTTAGEMARIGIGESMGVNPDMTLGQLFSISSEKGENAAIAILMTNMLQRLGKRLVNGRLPAISKEKAQWLLDNAEEGAQIANEINSRLDDATFTLRVDQMAKDPAMSDQVATIRSRNADVERMERDREYLNEQAIDRYWDVSFGSRVGKYETSAEVKRKLIQLPEQRLRRAEELSNSSKYVMLSHIDKVPVLNESMLGKQVRESLITQRQAAKDLEKIAWDRVDQVSGYDPVTASSQYKIPKSDEVNKIVSRLSNESKKSLFTDESAGKAALIANLKKDEGDGIDFATLSNGIKHLNRKIRIQENGEVADDAPLGELRNLRDAMVRMRDDYLMENAPELLYEVKNAELMSAIRADTYDRGIVGTILTKEGANRYKLNDAAVLSAVLIKRDAQAARELTGALIADPRAMQAVREQVYADYINKTTDQKTGLINPKLHEKYMKEYGETIKPFFSLSDDYKSIQTMGMMAEVVEKRANQVVDIEKAFNKSFRGKIKDMNPESIVDAFFSSARSTGAKTSLSYEDIGKLRRFSKSVGAYDATVNIVTDEIRRRVFKDGVYSHEALNNLLIKHGDDLANFLPAGYIDDLNTLNKALAMVETSGKALPSPPKGTIMELIRAKLGPLNERQRIITAGKRINATSADAALIRAVLDPDRLKQLIKAKDVRLSSQQGIDILASIGAIDLTETNLPEEN